MGCGIAKDSDDNTIVVCQYSPRGNIITADFDFPFGPFQDNVLPIPWDVCNSIIIPDPVNWPPIEGEINITEEMCKRYHFAYIEAGMAAGAKIKLDAEVWAETTRAEAWAYSVKIRAEADAYKAKIQAEMQKWRVEYIAKIKLDIEASLVIEIKVARENADRDLAAAIFEYRATMEAEILALQVWYKAQI